MICKVRRAVDGGMMWSLPEVKVERSKELLRRRKDALGCCVRVLTNTINTENANARVKVASLKIYNPLLQLVSSDRGDPKRGGAWGTEAPEVLYCDASCHSLEGPGADQWIYSPVVVTSA